MMKTTRQRHRVKNTLLVILMLLLAPLLGSFGTLTLLVANGRVSLPQLVASIRYTTPVAHYTALTAHVPTLPTPRVFKLVSDKAVNISVRYPTDWTISAQALADGSHFIGITSPGQAAINFYLSHLPISATASYADATQLSRANIQGLIQVQNIRQLQFVKAVNYRPVIGGITWSEQDATFVTTENEKVVTEHYTSIAVFHQKTYYMIYFYLPDALYAQALQKYFTPMLASVHFVV